TPDFLPETETVGREGWEGLALNLSNLDRRQFWVRRRGIYEPVRKRTLELADPQLTPQLERAVRWLMATSSETYGYKINQSISGQEVQGIEQGAALATPQSAANFATLAPDEPIHDQATNTAGGEDEDQLWN
ncbi:MAG: hypothetical protein KDE53_28875, partial [Caldilineaceae bacterium]|nr:hypothetical protein [Caldilineaceae bacterium]